MATETASAVRQVRGNPPTGLAAIVVMGVSGAGKTSIGAPLAAHLGCAFLEGDDLHPPANIAKMARGEALDDGDRWPWLHQLAARIAGWRQRGECGVLACSALKRTYRALLSGGRGDVLFVYLHGSAELLQQRLARRPGHFMPASLLDSQLRTLEVPAAGECLIAVDAAQPPETILQHILRHLADWQQQQGCAPAPGADHAAGARP